MVQPKPVLRVGFILSQRFTLSAFANFVDVLRLAADEGDRSRQVRCSWTVLSATMNPVKSSCGVPVFPDQRLGDPRQFDYLVVVGGLIEAIERLNPDYVNYLRLAAEADVPIVGVCTGAFILHQAGLMHGYKCCVSWFHHDDFLEQFDGIEPVSDQIFVVDRDRMTCSGGASSAHLAAFLVSRHVGQSAAAKSLHIMIIDEAKDEENPQPGIPIDFSTEDPLVTKALHMIQQNMSVPPAVSAIAQRLGISRRKLERHFRDALGTTPAEAGISMRLARGRQLLETSDLSVTRIAHETGFCDDSHFIRSFGKREGTTPADYRRRFADLKSSAQ
ncbi:GlxA family transcriptional regulator [Hoeflea sp. TYP-13]|uniref:GlxA family transcriptional regulator n=1 Tax=Hoeflea sp. TYP-13 TaxID=3230023 RepID=UPI0034C6CA2C